MILSNVKIVEAIEKGHISITPPPPRDPGAPPFNTSSIDLTLVDEMTPGIKICQLIVETVDGTPAFAPNQFRGQGAPQGRTSG